MGGFAAVLPAIQAVGTILGGVSAIGGLMGSKKSSAPAPAVSKPTVMPEPDDAATRAARRRSAASQSQRGGRQSTILSDDFAGEPLGA